MFGCKFPGWVMQMKMSCLEPHLISNLPGGESPCGSRAMIFQVDSWAARASFLALLRIERQFLRVGRKVLPRGG